MGAEVEPSESPLGYAPLVEVVEVVVLTVTVRAVTLIVTVTVTITITIKVIVIVKEDDRRMLVEPILKKNRFLGPKGRTKISNLMTRKTL